MIETKDGNATVFKADHFDDADFVRSRCPITTVRVIEYGQTDEVTIFNRGANAGRIVVRGGDGRRIAQRLLTPEP